MRQGRFEENECCLRMKIDMTHVNPNMRDPVAYRIRYVPHPHAGDKWCIYPTYDYTHCINDSLENITHSCCTLEFENRRESYYWLLEALDLYKPIVWEYSRLNLTYTVLSKRKLEKLVGEKVVNDWEDPRMPTVLGLKRRGYTPSMINDFAAEIGVSRKGNDNTTSIKLLENYARKELDVTAPRTFGVQEPVLLEIVNYDELAVKEFEAPLFPADKTKGTQIYKLSKRVYIDEEDFSEEHKGGFFGLTPNQPVCLKYGPVVQLIEIKKDASGKIEKVLVKVLPDFKEKLKGFIHWVSEEHSENAEFRLYGYLFDCEIVPNEEWEKHINKESLIVKPNAKVWTNISLNAKEYDRFQFERLAFFVVDSDSRKESVGGKLVFNRIVELKESKEKKVNLGK
jgi:glutaminyl-tRNA synthetase